MMNSRNQLAAGIVGTGFMGWVHAEALHRIGIPIQGVVGSSPEKSEAAKQRYRAARAYDSFEAMLDDPDCRVIHILTPNDTHYRMAKLAIAAGKHVLCEKPLAIKPEQSAELVELAKNSPRVKCGVNYNIRFYPLCLEARQRIANGQLGSLFHVSGSYVQDWLHQPTDYNWRVLADRAGSLRAVADIGTHWLDLVQFLAGQHITSVCADLQTVFTERQKPLGEVQTFSGASSDVKTEAISINTDDAASILLHFASGARGTVHVSQVTAGRKNCLRLELAGSASAISWNSETPNELWIGHRETPNELLVRDPSLLHEAARERTSYPGGHNEGYDDSFKHCFATFYEAIATDLPIEQTPVATFLDGHRELLLCAAIEASHHQRRWIDVQP